MSFNQPLTFPPECIECTAGDHLIGRMTEGRWQVYRVDDILAVQRLVPDGGSPPRLIAEADLLDSLKPAYFAEAQLLLSLCGPTFNDENAARQAIEHRALTIQVEGLLRPLHSFLKADCRVVPP